MGKLDGKVAVVTGAASGIGEATARLFHAEGAAVVLSDIQDERGAGLAAELGERAAYRRADVTSEDDLAALADFAAARFGALDIMFNNAGAQGVSAPIAETSVEGFDLTVDLLLRSVFLGMKHAARVMSPRGAGSIVSTASVAGLRTGHAPHIYSACKAAVIHLTHSVAMELAEQGIRVNCVCPGFIATGIFGNAFGLPPEASRALAPLMAPMQVNAQPLRHAGQPADIAQAVLWLASDDARFVTGHALVVDGGLIAGRSWTEYQRLRESLAQGIQMAMGQASAAAPGA
ncbi:MAG: 2,5-dichloro-2,5-cyclohexadiene-1,4-diol dehydrogenase [Chloracidobacterium sp. CP2_5A]|nr:MAG: 2,5-dichloro-2,5-cyclohexadiene-1,4-diol dehydrogenase [Chloracidobacterium sp. CP2_5A]